MIIQGEKSKVVYKGDELIAQNIGNGIIYTDSKIPDDIYEGDVLFLSGATTECFNTASVDPIYPSTDYMISFTYTPFEYVTNTWILNCRYNNGNGTQVDSNIMQYASRTRIGCLTKSDSMSGASDMFTTSAGCEDTISWWATPNSAGTYTIEATDTLWSNHASVDTVNAENFEGGTPQAYKVQVIGSTPHQNVRIKGWKVTELATSSVTHDFVFRSVNGKPNMYDKITGKYFPSEGDQDSMVSILKMRVDATPQSQITANTGGYITDYDIPYDQYGFKCYKWENPRIGYLDIKIPRGVTNIPFKIRQSTYVNGIAVKFYELDSKTEVREGIDMINIPKYYDSYGRFKYSYTIADNSTDHTLRIEVHSAGNATVQGNVYICIPTDIGHSMLI